MVPVFNISTTKYTRYRADETPLEKLILGNQSVLNGQPNNESMSPDGLRKPDRIVPVNRRPLWPKVVPSRAYSENPRRIWSPRDNILSRGINMAIGTTVLDSNKVP